MSLGDAVGGRVARSAHARLALTMPRDGAIIFRDLVGKLTVLRITCDKCGRSGQYRLDRLILLPDHSEFMMYGNDVMDFTILGLCSM